MIRLLSVLVALLALSAMSSMSAPHADSCAFYITPTTYEGPRDRGIYAAGMDLAAYNQFAPTSTFFGIPTVEKGSRASRMSGGESYIPPTLLKAISWIESHWWQAASSVPYQGVGPALISFDCGHGLTQVTTGMTSPEDGYWPSPRQVMIPTHYLWNIGRGSAILVGKWNSAPEVRPIVGNGNPRIVEDWYYALWSYNGFASVNNPLNHDTVGRSPFSCSSNLNDGYSHNRGLFPYQELIYGCASRPPSVDGVRLWSPLPVTLPNLDSATWRGPISNFPNTSLMDFPTPWINNRDSTPPRPAGTRAMLWGAPQLKLSTNRITANTGQVTISNVGTGILSWRALPEDSWIGVNKMGGVALGRYMPCGEPCDRSATLTITVDTSRAPASGVGKVRIESLISGQIKWVEVVRGGQPPPPPSTDSDYDGCKDTREMGSDPALGGLRDPLYFWDFFDTPNANNIRDGVVNSEDLARLLARFGTSGDIVMPTTAPGSSGYHTAFDRGAPRSSLPWDASVADGRINAVDLFVLISQIGHNCN